MKKKILIIALSVILLMAIGAGILFFGGNQITIARCIVTDSGTLYMVFDERPIKLNYEKDVNYQTGDKLLIVHSTAFAESYPEQASVAFIIKIGSGTAEDIPQKAFEAID